MIRLGHSYLAVSVNLIFTIHIYPFKLFICNENYLANNDTYEKPTAVIRENNLIASVKPE